MQALHYRPIREINSSKVSPRTHWKQAGGGQIAAIGPLRMQTCPTGTAMSVLGCSRALGHSGVRQVRTRPRVGWVEFGEAFLLTVQTAVAAGRCSSHLGRKQNAK